MARATKLTPETETRIIEAIRSGLPEKHAAQAAGIDDGTYFRWKRRGEIADRTWRQLSPEQRQTEARYREFRGRVIRALDESVVLLAGSVRLAATPHDVEETVTTTKVIGGETVVETRVTRRREHDWRAAAWMLERRAPALFAKTQQIELAGPDGGPVPVAVNVEAVERARRLVEVARSKAERARADRPGA